MKQPDFLDMKYKQRQELLRSVKKEVQAKPKKFKEEELLKKLNKAFEYLPLSIANGQAHRQIRERVQSYTEHQELELCYMDIILDLYDRLEQKKPQVTEGWMNAKTDELFRHTDELFKWQQLKDFIRSFVKEIQGK